MRILQLAMVLWRFAVVPGLRRLFGLRTAPGPLRLRQALVHLGGSWIKLGQALALRFDLLPAAYCYELFELLNQIEGFPYEQVRQVVMDDLGAEPEELFASFATKPFAAASVGQVHRAVLHDGTVAAVKVQRPGIRRLVSKDLRLMYFGARTVDFFHLLGGVRANQIVDEFARWTSDELDFRVEARNAYTLRGNSTDDDLEYEPKIYFELSSDRVLTMELLEGRTLYEVIVGLRRSRGAGRPDATSLGLDQLAAHLCWNLLNQVYVLGMFHADLHPANLIARPDGSIGYVDFGIVGSLGEDVRQSLLHYAWNLFHGDVPRATDEFMRWVRPTAATNTASARADLSKIFNDYLFQLQHQELASAPFAQSTFEVAVLGSIRQHRMTMAPEVITYFKALVTANAVIFELDPHFDLLALESRFFSRMIATDAWSWTDPSLAASRLFDLNYRLTTAFGDFSSLRQDEGDLQALAGRVKQRLGALALVGALSAVTLYLFFGHVIQARSAGWIPAVVLVILVVDILAFLRQRRSLPSVQQTVSPRRLSRRPLPTRRVDGR